MGESQLEVRRELRQVVLFSRHNLITDPPFLNIDLVSVRNVLIYFNSVLQERVFSRIDHALDPGGVLFLGTSETPLSASSTFETRRGADRVFTKRPSATRRPAALDLRARDLDASRLSMADKASRRTAMPAPPKDLRFEALARAVAPNGFLVTATHDIVRVFGPISEVVELSEKVPLALSTMFLRGPMRNEAASLTTTALRARRSKTGDWHRLDPSADAEFRLRCYPMIGELQNANEELQSTNEELVTVNDEMHANTAELQRDTTELGAILSHSPYPVLIVDSALLIRRSSRRAKEFFELKDMPAGGLHVSQCVLPRGFPSFAEACAEAMESGDASSVAVELGVKQYTTTVTSFLDAEGTVLGVKVAVMEFDASGFESMANLMDEMGGLTHWRLNIATNSLHWSKEVFRIHGLDPTKPPPTVGEAIRYYAPDDRARMADYVDRAIREKRPHIFEACLIHADGRTVPVQSSCGVVTDGAGMPTYLVGAFRDLSARASQAAINRQLGSVCAQALAGFFAFDLGANRLTLSTGARHVTGVECTANGRGVEVLAGCYGADDAGEMRRLVEEAVTTGRGFAFEGVLAEGSGAGRRCRCACSVEAEDGGVTHLYGSLSFVDDR